MLSYALLGQAAGRIKRNSSVPNTLIVFSCVSGTVSLIPKIKGFMAKAVTALQNQPRDADFGHEQASDIAVRVGFEQAQFGGGHGEGERGFDAEAEGLAGVGVETGRDVDREDRFAGLIDRLDGFRVKFTDAAGCAGAEERVDDQCGFFETGQALAGRKGVEAFEADAQAASHLIVESQAPFILRGILEQPGLYVIAPIVQRPRRRDPVAAVVSPAAENNHAPRLS